MLALETRELLGSLRTELDSRAKFRSERLSGSRESGGIDFKIMAVVIVEARRETADGIKASCLDFPQHPTHRGGNRGIPLRFRIVKLRAFQLNKSRRIISDEPGAEFHTSELAVALHARQRRLTLGNS